MGLSVIFRLTCILISLFLCFWDSRYGWIRREGQCVFILNLKRNFFLPLQIWVNILQWKIIKMVKNYFKGWWDGAADKVACCQAWEPEFNSWDSLDFWGSITRQNAERDQSVAFNRWDCAYQHMQWGAASLPWEVEGSTREKLVANLYRDRVSPLRKGKWLQLEGVLLTPLKVICNLLGILFYNQGTLSGPTRQEKVNLHKLSSGLHAFIHTINKTKKIQKGIILCWNMAFTCSIVFYIYLFFCV